MSGRPRGSHESADPRKRLGVFKTYSAVPPQYRLGQYEAAFEGRDVWGEWMAAENPDYSENVMRYTYEPTEALLKEVAAAAGRHHALITPDEVDELFGRVVGEYSEQTILERRFFPLEAFFEWLTFRVEYPHRFNVVWMAAARPGPTAEIWAYRQEWKTAFRK